MTSHYSQHVITSAIAVFSLSPVYSHKDLSAAYRRVALRCHPDKGGRQDLFDTVRECYRVLHEHARLTGMWDSSVSQVRDSYDRSVTDRAFEERRGFPADAWRTGAAGRKMSPASGSAFNVAEFNRRYEEGRSRNEERDTGYAGWLSKAAAEYSEQTKPAINPKSGSRAFNSAFERLTPALDGQTGAIIIHPESINAGGLCGALYDESEEVSDYTTDVGGGVSGADCRLAHGNQRLASDSWARDEVRVDRATISRLHSERSYNIPRQCAEGSLASEIQLAMHSLSRAGS